MPAYALSPSSRGKPRLFRAAALSAFAIFVAAAAHAQQADRIPAQFDATQRIALRDHLAPWATPDRDLGRISPDTPLAYLRLTLARAPRQEAAFQQLLRDQQDPHSARYHQWWTPEALGATFGPTPQDLAAIETWLTAQGFAVDRVAHSRMFVVFHGSAAQTEAAFKTELHSFSTVRGPQIGINAPPQIPAALAPVIASVQGLSASPLDPAVHAGPGFSLCNGTCQYFVVPADFATIYDINPVYNQAIKGAGQTIAIVGRSEVWSDDITEYESITGLPSATPTIIVPPGGVSPGAPATAPPGSGDQGEATLDVQRSYGTAPAATVDLVVSKSTRTEDGVDIAKDYIIDDYSTLKASIMTNSFGQCEAQVAPSVITADDTLFQQAAAEGISSIGISGDSGAAGCDPYNATPPAGQQVLSPNRLCASGYVTCVGGTQFIDTADPAKYWSSTNSAMLGSVLSYIPEGAWNDPLNSDDVVQASASGGGVSSVVATPSWQTGPGVPGTAGRYTPDIAFNASGHDGYFGCYSAGGGNCGDDYFEYFSGTSAGAPSFAGIVALLDEKQGSAQGALNPELYALANSVYTSVYHDATVATSGITGCTLATPSLCNNSTPSDDSLTGGLEGYELTTGFDLVTGWGSIDVANLLSNWDVTAPAATATALTISPGTTLAAGTSATLSAVVTAASGTPSGSVKFVADGLTVGTATLSGGKGSLMVSTKGIAPGNYSLVAEYAGTSSDAPSNSASVTATVTKAASTSTLSISPSSVDPPAKATFSVTVTSPDGTPSGSVTFYYGSRSIGSATLSGGKASLAESSSGIPAGSYAIHAVYGGSSSIMSSTSNTVDVTVQ